jgi:hypothetical protein
MSLMKMKEDNKLSEEDQAAGETEPINTPLSPEAREWHHEFELLRMAREQSFKKMKVREEEQERSRVSFTSFNNILFLFFF